MKTVSNEQFTFFSKLDEMILSEDMVNLAWHKHWKQEETARLTLFTYASKFTDDTFCILLAHLHQSRNKKCKYVFTVRLPGLLLPVPSHLQ